MAYPPNMTQSPIPSAPPAYGSLGMPQTLQPLQPQYYPQSWDDAKRQEFDQLCACNEIHPEYAQEARYLMGGVKKLFVIDNSGSQTRLLDVTKTQARLSRGHPPRRYDEVIEFVRKAMPVMALDARDGVDFYFINPVNGKQFYPNIHTWEQIRPVFDASPSGLTPLCQTLEWAYSHYSGIIDEQGLIAVIITDGEPYDGTAKESKKRFYDLSSAGRIQ